MLHVCIELWYQMISSWVLALGEKLRNSECEKQQLPCAWSKLDKTSLVTFSVGDAPFFPIVLLSDFCSLPRKILKRLLLGHNYLCSTGIPYSGNLFLTMLSRKGAGHLQC